MKRTTPRPINPNRELYKKYADTQLTLEEILDQFSNYTIYGIIENTSIYIVDDENIVILFDRYDDEDTLYGAYPNPKPLCTVPTTILLNTLMKNGCPTPTTLKSS